MKENRKKIAFVAIVVLMLIMAFELGRCTRQETQEPDPGTSSSQGTNQTDGSTTKPDSSTTEPNVTDKPLVDQKPDDVTTKPGGEEKEPGTNENKPGETKPTSPAKPSKPNNGPANSKNETTKPIQKDPDKIDEQKPVTKTDPMNGWDYIIPKGLTGKAGEELVTVYLKNDTHLVWVNPHEVMSTDKLCYQAKFVETDDKNEKIVTVSVLVTQKLDPVKGIDYKIPSGLRGTEGRKLSSISLKDSNLVWSNPDEILSPRKSEYQAKFLGTETKNEITVMVKVTVWHVSNDNDDDSSGGGGSTLNPPDKPDKPDVPSEPDTPDVPDVPDVPTEPDTPTDPDQPTDPDTPDVPDVPIEPDTPTDPDQPTDPDTPDVPDVPSEPDTPDVPDVPTEPDTPDVSDVPSEPDTPDVLDVPTEG